ncbi:alternate-type signal peptide domain-containing protein [Tessaracoccus sp. OS52]|uniref:alternate-type signal peptide domain-containing protein n=1 Tax=Tessaracoccus sp. OS52 TaxID=2886691 RepID=UPI001D10C474|nr:alternate-type signal peptide domain-containing protein [Tessaracoccus sp. OS52]MCC2594706.1 alternate-type signal peptide domain-containing protein [Tessaracoccus sp. OS52]
MNKMIKGAVVSGVGVALLLGGGGTLAVWNSAQESSAGQIVAGDLNLEAGAGSWKSNLSGAISDISTYRVIPGETLTYTQPLTVTLVGDELEATLKVTGASANNGFTAANVAISEPTLANSAGDVLASTVLDEDSPETVTASTSFTFKSTTTGRDSVNATYDFAAIGYLLEQLAPSEG